MTTVMVAPDLVQVFESLVAPTATASGRDLTAVPIPGADTHRIAKDAGGAPCLLIRHPPQTGLSAPIRLEHLLVSFSVPCTITQPGGTPEQGTFTIVRCSTANPKLFLHFLKIISPIVVALGPSPTPAAIRRAISGLVDLFQALAAPATKTIQGVWAELLLIRLATDPMAMARAWRKESVEHFDFADGSQRIEVKSSSRRRREHYFSLSQLTPAAGADVVVASLFVERAGGGVSLQKMFDDTRTLIADDPYLATRFDSVFYSSLGSGWADAMDESFDWEVAVESVAFFWVESVPKVDNVSPQTVFDVRFRSDLGGVTPLDPERLRSRRGLLAAAIPAR